MALALTGCVSRPRRAALPGSDRQQLQQLQEQVKEVAVSVERLGRRLEELDTRTNALAEELTRARRASPLAPLELETAPPTTVGQVSLEPMQEFEVARISLGMLTGSANWDGQPGDDGIMVYLYPLDQSGDTVKRAGDCTFELFDLSRSKQHLTMTWHIPAAQAAGHWQTFPGCYRFKLAWQGSPPEAERPILKVTFLTLTGQQFTETKRLRVQRAPETEVTE